MKVFIGVICACILSGCSLLGIHQPLSFDQTLAAAYGTHTAVTQAAATAVTAGTLSGAAAVQVQTMAHSSRTLLDEAKAAEGAGNASEASAELLLATQALTALQTYVNGKVKP